ncbi:phosphotransferase enzyme family protein [Frateuria aurantia]
MSSSPHHVHGLADNQVPPDWPPLNLADLRSLAAHYPQLGATQTLRWHSPRPLSAAAIVETTGGPVFVKRHHQRVRSTDDLEEEHDFIRHLQAGGMAIPRLIENRRQRTATADGEWSYELSELATGQDLYRDSVSWEPLRNRQHAWAAGAALARLHLASQGYLAAQRRTHLLLDRGELIASPDPIATLQGQLRCRPGLRAYLQQHPWQQQIEALFARRPADLPSRLQRAAPLWTHNDWHVSNLTWRVDQERAEVCNVLDFGLSARTTAIHDLATAIERNAIAWLRLELGMAAVHIDIALNLLEGYNQVRPLSSSDLALLRDVLPLVHVDFALSEVEYFQAVTGSIADADVAWNTFLLGHAHWFSTPPGRRLLAALEGSS